MYYPPFEWSWYLGQKGKCSWKKLLIDLCCFLFNGDATFSFLPTVKRDVQEDDEEAVRVKEQSILELGTLLAMTGQAAGRDGPY